MTRNRIIIATLALLAGGGVATLLMSQSLLDAGPYNSMTLGAGTDVDRCINWDLASTDATFCYDDGGGLASADVFKTTGYSLQVDGGIFIRSTTPSMSFADSDTAIVTSSFTSPATDTTGGSEDSQFVINTTVNGSVVERLIIDTTSNSNPFVGLSKSSTTARLGYTGTGQYVFLTLSTGELTGFDVIAPTIFVGGTAPTFVVVKSPDGTCSQCGASDADAWSCTGLGSCPSVTP